MFFPLGYEKYLFLCSSCNSQWPRQHFSCENLVHHHSQRQIIEGSLIPLANLVFPGLNGVLLTSLYGVGHCRLWTREFDSHCPILQCFCSVSSCSSAGKCTSPIALVQIHRVKEKGRTGICIAAWSFPRQKNFSIRLSNIIAPTNTNSKAANCMRVVSRGQCLSSKSTIIAHSFRQFHTMTLSTILPFQIVSHNSIILPLRNMMLTPEDHTPMGLDWASTSTSIMTYHYLSTWNLRRRLHGWRKSKRT